MLLSTLPILVTDACLLLLLRFAIPAVMLYHVRWRRPRTNDFPLAIGCKKESQRLFSPLGQMNGVFPVTAVLLDS